jgi:hypothetical protein
MTYPSISQPSGTASAAGARKEMEMKPIMTDWGLLTADGHHWLVSDGEFPFDDCDDRCTSHARERNRRDWERRKAAAAKLEEDAVTRGMTVTELLSDRVSGVF